MLYLVTLLFGFPVLFACGFPFLFPISIHVGFHFSFSLAEALSVIMQDLFSRLPDELLCLILSKLRIKEAVSCSLISKRWRYLYTQIPQLTISPSMLLDQEDDYENVDSVLIARVENLITDILLRHSSDLEAFRLLKKIEMWGYSGHVNPWHFTRESVWNWLEIVSRKNVQHLSLCHLSTEKDIPPPALFSCTRLTTLTLTNYSLSRPPTHFTRFNHLITCSLEEMVFTDDECLANFISHCPLLQKLSLLCCNGLREPEICASNLKHLHIYDYCVQALILNCPKLETVKADMTDLNDLRVNGLLFHKLSNRIDQLKLECGSNLVGFSLRESEEIDNLSADNFIEVLGSFKSLKELDIYTWMITLKREEQMTVPLINLFERLPNLERVHIPATFLLEIGLDPVPPCLTSPLDNLRMVSVDMKDYIKWEVDVSDLDQEIAVLECLLQSTPALETVEFQIPEDENEDVGEIFTEIFLELSEVSRASAQAKIRVKKN